MFKEIKKEQIEEYGFNADIDNILFHENTENFYIYNEEFFVIENEEAFLICIRKSEKDEFFYIKKESRKVDYAYAVYHTDMLNFVSTFSDKFNQVTVSKNEEGRYCIFAETKTKTTDKMILKFISEQLED